MSSEKEKKKVINWKVLLSTVFSVVVASALVIFGYNIEPNDYPTTYIICLFGAVVGWTIGILTSPYSKGEESKLSKFSGLIGTFLSGYILSKFDKVLEQLLETNLLQDKLIGLRLILFICSFCLSWIIVYVYRTYVSIEGRSDADHEHKVKQIERLGNLQNLGLLSAEEFEIEKKKILK